MKLGKKTIKYLEFIRLVGEGKAKDGLAEHLNPEIKTKKWYPKYKQAMESNIKLNLELAKKELR